ncbi:MAG: hypothetical protein RDV41_03020 [Planctomycetota bacterium]|nr:hypothetical protein [Planctomycetota bacterium]
MKEVVKALSLNAGQVVRSVRAFRDCQTAVMQLVMIPRDDGVNMLEEIGKLESDPTMKQQDRELRFIELLTLNVPGSDKMYLTRIEELKTALDEKLGKILTEEQFRRYKDLQIEPLDIQELDKTE